MTATNYRITDTLDAAVLTIVQQALDKIISPDEAKRRIRRAERLMMEERLRGMGLAPPAQEVAQLDNKRRAMAISNQLAAAKVRLLGFDLNHAFWRIAK
jgi:hypothetical protein